MKIGIVEKIFVACNRVAGALFGAPRLPEMPPPPLFPPTVDETLADGYVLYDIEQRNKRRNQRQRKRSAKRAKAKR